MDKRDRLSALALVATVAVWAASPPLAHSAPAPAPPSVVIADDGPTQLTARGADGVTVTVDVVAAVQKSLPPDAITACTGGRVPCSLVRALRIRHGETAVEVPDALPLRLADVNRAVLAARPNGQYLLTLTCGDAAASYDARILFDTARVVRLEIVSRLANAVTERTYYTSIKDAFE